MSARKRYKVLIVEDERLYSEPLKESIKSDQEFEVLAITDSVNQAYNLIQTGLPDVIIVDLQLKEGDGMDLLSRIREIKENLAIKPYILTITAFASNTIATALNNGLADYMLNKKNESFSPDLVLNHLRIMSQQFHRNKKPEAQIIDSSLETEAILRARINSELEQYYMSQSTQSKDYLAEAIYLASQVSKYDKLEIGQIYLNVGKLYRKDPHNVDMAIRRLINTAFMNTNPDDIERIYKPYLDTNRGVPKNKEFIAYVANKIKKENI